MTHLKIELNTGSREIVSDKIIKKLYELVSSGTLDNTSHLQGWLYVPVTYRLYQETITDDNSDITKDLTVDCGDFAIPFEDSNMITYLNSIGVGSNGSITEALAAAATMVANSTNTTITKFNELRYFTNITSSKGGFDSGYSGYVRFANWTALEEVDISNFTSLGHCNGFAHEDTFQGCTSLRKVTASNKLTYLGYRSFYNCSNLEEITGLSGEITIYGPVFYGCVKLPLSFFTPLTFKFYNNLDENSSGSAFENCNLLTDITLSSTVTTIPRYAFSNCSNLETVSGLSGDISVCRNAFLGCTKLKSDSFLNCKIIFPQDNGNYSFSNCRALTSMDISGYVGSECFINCTNLRTVNLSELLTVGSLGFWGSIIEGNINSPNLTYMGYRAFRETNIGKILNLGSITEIPLECFHSCILLTEATLPSTCIRLRDSAFSGAVSLQSINVENIVTMEPYVFSNTPALSNCVMYFKELISEVDVDHNVVNPVRNSLFVGGFKYVYAPKLQSCGGGFDAGGNQVRGLFVSNGWSNSCTDKTIVYFKNLSSVETGAFCGGIVKHLIINNSTPPTVTAHSEKKQNLLIDVSGNGVNRSVVQNVWVPRSAITSYQNDTYWGEFGNRIQAIEDFNKVATKALWDQLSSSSKEDTLIEEYM